MNPTELGGSNLGQPRHTKKREGGGRNQSTGDGRERERGVGEGEREVRKEVSEGPCPQPLHSSQ